MIRKIWLVPCQVVSEIVKIVKQPDSLILKESGYLVLFKYGYID